MMAILYHSRVLWALDADSISYSCPLGPSWPFYIILLSSRPLMVFYIILMSSRTLMAILYQ